MERCMIGAAEKLAQLYVEYFKRMNPCTRASELRSRLNNLLSAREIRVCRLDRSRNSIESQTGRLGRELYFTANIEECKISRNKMMCHTSSFVQNIDLPADDVFCFFAGVV